MISISVRKTLQPIGSCFACLGKKQEVNTVTQTPLQLNNRGLFDLPITKEDQLNPVIFVMKVEKVRKNWLLRSTM